jgi:hypothetical protein
MLHFHKTNEFSIVVGGYLRIISCFTWMSLVDVLTRIVLTGNYKKKNLLTLSLFVLYCNKMLDMKPLWYCKYQKINIRRYFTIYIIFNDKIVPDQCGYIIPYRLYDVTGRINPRMHYAFCLLHIEEFWKMAIPIIWATGNFNHQILPYGILFLTLISTNVFYLLSFKFSH